MPLYEMEGPAPGPPAGGRRHLLLTAEMQDEIVKQLDTGALNDEVAKAVGVSRTSYYEWLSKGRTARDRAEAGHDLSPNEIKYMDFAVAVDGARGRATVYAHETIRKAMPKTWQAAAWYLERTNPRRYGRWIRTADDVPTADELEDPPTLPDDDDVAIAEVDAVVTHAQRWLAERGRAAEAT